MHRGFVPAIFPAIFPELSSGTPKKNPETATAFSNFLFSNESQVNPREKLYTPPPPPPISGQKAFFRGGGWGCIF